LGVAFVLAYRSGTSPPSSSDRATIEANRESQLVVREDQLPHTAPVPRGATPRLALTRIVAADLRGRIQRHSLQGPIERARCTPSRPLRVGRQPFHCTVTAAGVQYPFVGVVDLHARRADWCKRDPPVVPSLDVPVSRRCRA
jgi:hypothetical protein